MSTKSSNLTASAFVEDMMMIQFRDTLRRATDFLITVLNNYIPNHVFVNSWSCDLIRISNYVMKGWSLCIAMQCTFLNAEHLSSSGICHKKNFSGDLQSSFGSLTNLTWLWVFLVLDWCLSSKLNVIQDFIFKCICRYLQNNKITRYIRASRWAYTDFPVGDPHCFLLQLMLYVPLIACLHKNAYRNIQENYFSGTNPKHTSLIVSSIDSTFL